MSGLRSDTRRGAPTHGEWRDLLARFTTTLPELLARRGLRSRTDSKFLLPPSAAADLVRGLAGDYAVLPAGEELVASYRTLCFDTPDLDFFHAQRRGRRVRHKARIRHHVNRRVTSLEVKTRVSELRTIKTRRERDYGDDVLSAEDLAFIAAHTEIGRGVLPQVWTEFRRLMLLGIRTNERVTVDLDFTVRMGRRGRSFAAVAIVEVKQWPLCRSTPAMSALRAAGWRPGWMSKFATAIAFTRPDVRINSLMPGLRTLTRSSS